MNEYRMIYDGKIVTETELRAACPAVLPAVLDKGALEFAGAEPVLRSPVPAVTDRQRAVRQGAVKDAKGNWVQHYVVQNLYDNEADEALQTLIREKRAELLIACAAKQQEVQARGCKYEFPDTKQGTIQTRDAKDLANVNGLATTALILHGQGVSAPVLEFRDTENVSHAMRPADMLAMAMAAGMYVSSTYAAKWTHDEAIAAWTGGAAYDLEAGWPA